jgi:hypothetical protein
METHLNITLDGIIFTIRRRRIRLNISSTSLFTAILGFQQADIVSSYRGRSVSSSVTVPHTTSDHFSSSQQARRGNCSRCLMRYQRIHSAGRILRLGPCLEYLALGTRLGWHSFRSLHSSSPNSMYMPRGINIFRSPDPKSSNPVFDDGMMIEAGEILFGIVEKKTIGATHSGLIHVVFCE